MKARTENRLTGVGIVVLGVGMLSIVVASCGDDPSPKEVTVAPKGADVVKWEPRSIEQFDVPGDDFGALWTFCDNYGHRVYMTEVIRRGDANGASAAIHVLTDSSCQR